MQTRRTDRRRGAALVRRAIRHGLVPEFRYGIPLSSQTKATRWALHVLAVMSVDGKADMDQVERVVVQTQDIAMGWFRTLSGL